MLCLTETDGDKDKAVEYLREKGLATAAKKSGRIAAEGLVMMIRGMSPEIKEDLYARYLKVLTPKLVRLDRLNKP